MLAYWLLDSNQVSKLFPVYTGTLIIYAAFGAAMLISAGCALIIGRAIKKTDELSSLGRLDLAIVALAFNLYYWMTIPAAVKTAGSLSGMAATLNFPLSAVILTGIAMLTVIWLRRAWVVPGQSST